MTDLVTLERQIERDAVVDHIRLKMAEVDSLSKRNRIGAHEASLLNRRLEAIADEIAQGMHR